MDTVGRTGQHCTRHAVNDSYVMKIVVRFGNHHILSFFSTENYSHDSLLAKAEALLEKRIAAGEPLARFLKGQLYFEEVGLYCVSKKIFKIALKNVNVGQKRGIKNEFRYQYFKIFQ